MMSFRSTHGYAVAWIFDLKLLSSGSLGMSTQWPSQLYFQPWYTQRRPSSSLRPKKSDAPRCGQWFWMRPILPEVTRKAIRFSPSSRTRTGAPSRSGNSLDIRAGIQYWRNKFPVGVSRPTRQSSSLSSLESIVVSLFVGARLRHRRRAHVALHQPAHQHHHREHDRRHHQRRHRGLLEPPVRPLAQEQRGQHRGLGAVQERDGRQVAERDRELDHPPPTTPFFTRGSQILRNVEVHVPWWTRAASSSSRLIWIMLEPMIWVPNGKPRTMCARIITVRVP